MEGLGKKIVRVAEAGVVAAGLASSPEASAQEVIDSSMKDAVLNEIDSVLKGGQMKKIGEGKYEMRHNGVTLRIAIDQQTVHVVEPKITIQGQTNETVAVKMNEQQVTVEMNEPQVTIQGPTEGTVDVIVDEKSVKVGAPKL